MTAIAMTGTDSSEQVASDDAVLESLLHKVARISRVPCRALLPRCGTIIENKYRIEALIGRGGMGAVFRAVHIISQKSVALKWMLRTGSDEHMRARFLREVRAAGRIDHPNVVDVYDCGQDTEGCYLVMELLHGESLRARLERGPVASADAVDLLVPAMRGLSAVHRAGVIHRDLKPDNVFLCESRNGESREAKVLDFGISALHGLDTAQLPLTIAGTVIGTPAYMSPEQFQDGHDVDARCDVYALGVMLYETLTGQLPFEAESYAGLVVQVVNAAPRAPRALRPDLPLRLEQVVLRALAKRRQDRFSSVDELIAAILPFGSAAGASAEPAKRGVARRAQHRAALVVGAFALAGNWEASSPSSPQKHELAGSVAAGAYPSSATYQPLQSALMPLEAPSSDASAQFASTMEPPPRNGTVTTHERKLSSSGKRARKPGAKSVSQTSEPNPCVPPYSVDPAGRHIFKLECL
jgi:serine/threonine-protein kinase